jgi:hypothetical protein
MNATAEMQWRSPLTDAFGPDYATVRVPVEISNCKLA